MFKTRAPAVGRGKKEKKKTQPSFSEVFSKQCLEKWRQAVSVFVFSLGETKTLTAFGPACLHLAKARSCVFFIQSQPRPTMTSFLPSASGRAVGVFNSRRKAPHGQVIKMCRPGHGIGTFS